MSAEEPRAEAKKKQGGCGTVIALLVLVLVVALLALGVLSASRSKHVSDFTTADSSTSYRVIHRTGLYSSSTESAEQVRILDEGEVLIPPHGEREITCRTVTIEETSMNLCQVEVRKTGETGWVLRQWIEKQ